MRCKEGLCLLFVIFLGCIDKRKLEVLLVEVQTLFVDISSIKTERYVRIEDFLDKILINDTSVSLFLN